MTTSATKSGVATDQQPSRGQKAPPCSTGLTRTTRAIQVSHTLQAACTTFRLRSAPNSIRHAANRIRTANGYVTQLKRSIRAMPGTIISALNTRARRDAEAKHCGADSRQGCEAPRRSIRTHEDVLTDSILRE